MFFDSNSPTFSLVDRATGVAYDLGQHFSGDFTENDILALASLFEGTLDKCRDFLDKEAFLAARFDEVAPMDFYRELFSTGPGFERRGRYEDGKYNGLAMEISKDDAGHSRARVHVITQELGAIQRLQGSPFAFMAPISYVGNRRTAANAREIYALAVDLDGQTLDTLGVIAWQTQERRSAPTISSVDTWLPKPTFIVNSGTGVHLYYQFERPLPCYPNVMRGLKELKWALLPRIWNKDTSVDPYLQYQGVVQGFRVVGSLASLGPGYTVKAYRTGSKVSLEYLLRYVSDEVADSVRSNLKPALSSISKQEAKELYPEWYARVVEGLLPRQTWHVKRDLYDWWLRKCRDDKTGITVGHRYFCCMTAAVFAAKCDVEEEELTRDLLSLVKVFDALKSSDDEAFTEEDALRALDSYCDSYTTFPRKDLEKLTNVPMPQNKRNYRKQSVHLGRARAVQFFDDPEGNWRNKKGAPTKRDAILSYASEHPEANHSEIARALNVSRSTVIKWLRHSGDAE